MYKLKTAQRTNIYISVVLLLMMFMPLTGCDFIGDQAQKPEQGKDTKKDDGQKRDKSGFRSNVVLENLNIPWSIAFLDDKDAVMTERNGSLSLVSLNGKAQKREIEQIAINADGEGGLLGVAVHPNFNKNNFIYIYFTYGQGSNILNKVERYEFDRENVSLSNRRTIIDKIPGNQNHNGGRLKFGPDKKLYIATGDAQEPQLSQDRDSLAGKVLRLNDDGSIPKDNPFDDSPVYSLGHRNPQGMAWHPETNDMYATEHGQSANDEVNKIEAGKNYGWPDIIGSSDDSKFTNPVLTSGSETWAPSGADFYEGTGRYNNNLFFAALRGNHVHSVNFGTGAEIIDDKKLFEESYGRVRDVVFGPDDALYILTSNRDGRGNPVSNDDRLIKISLSD